MGRGRRGSAPALDGLRGQADPSMGILVLGQCSAKRCPAALRADAIGALVLVAAMGACSAVPTAGLWYQGDALALSADVEAQLADQL